jgi:hypothetical protein
MQGSLLHAIVCHLAHLLWAYPYLHCQGMYMTPDAFTLSRYVFNHRNQRMLAQALHELYEERKAMLVAQPPQQQQPQPPPQVLQCPRMAAYVRYCQEQQRRRVLIPCCAESVAPRSKSFGCLPPFHMRSERVGG